MYSEKNRLAGTNVVKIECIKVANILEEKFYASALRLSNSECIGELRGHLNILQKHFALPPAIQTIILCFPSCHRASITRYTHQARRQGGCDGCERTPPPFHGPKRSDWKDPKMNLRMPKIYLFF